MIFELINFLFHWLRQIILYQLLSYGNYGGVAKPLWPSTRNTMDYYCRVLDVIPPINGTDAACKLHDIETRLSKNINTGRYNWRKRRQADYKFLKRLQKCRITGLLEQIHNYIILIIYTLYSFILYNMNYTGIDNWIMDRDYVADNIPTREEYNDLKDIHKKTTKKFYKKYVN